MWIDVTPKEFYDTLLPKYGSIQALADKIAISPDRLFYRLGKGEWGNVVTLGNVAKLFSMERDVAEYEADGDEIILRRAELGLQNKDFGMLSMHISSIAYGLKPMTENSASIIADTLGCSWIDISKQVATWHKGKRYAGIKIFN